MDLIPPSDSGFKQTASSYLDHFSNSCYDRVPLDSKIPQTSITDCIGNLANR